MRWLALLGLAAGLLGAQGFLLRSRTGQPRPSPAWARPEGDDESGAQVIPGLGSLGDMMSCPCYSGKKYADCCQPVISSDEARDKAGPVELLQARFTAYVRSEVNFIIKTTHKSHPEYTLDVPKWKTELSDFIQFVEFTEFNIKRHQVVNSTMEMVTWSARIKVLPNIMSADKVQTKEFTERSKFLRENEKWWYAGGDEDFEPTNVLVDGPLSPNDPGPVRSPTPASKKSREKVPA